MIQGKLRGLKLYSTSIQPNSGFQRFPKRDSIFKIWDFIGQGMTTKERGKFQVEAQCVWRHASVKGRVMKEEHQRITHDQYMQRTVSGRKEADEVRRGRS